MKFIENDKRFLWQLLKGDGKSEAAEHDEDS